MYLEVTQFVGRMAQRACDALPRPRSRCFACIIVCAAAGISGCDTSGVYLGSDAIDGGSSGRHDASTGAPRMPDAGARDAGRGQLTRDASSSCPVGSADCDHDAKNGCETDLMLDRDHCGSCDTACKSADCVCQDGVLVARCSGSRADCNSDPSDGCEVDLASDANHCGSCETTCALRGGLFDTFGARCSAGTCMLNCEPGMGDCDGDPSTGCEAFLFADNHNCGACGVACNCKGGRCM